jgi:uncharacterized protein YgiM (DUF1202 family)
MHNMERPSTIIVVVVTLALAGIVGLAIPLASGGNPSSGQAAWKSPTPIPPTAPVPAATATEPAAPAPTQTATLVPTATATSEPSTATPPVELTPSRAPTAEAVATLPAKPTAASQPTKSPTLLPGTPGTLLSAVVAVDLLNLRDGPGQGFGVIGLGRSGETYTATARSGDGAWLQVCCLNQAPAWLATGMVTITGRLESLPVAP